MTWDDVLKIAAAVFAGVGGISGIIILAVKFASNIIAKRLEERYTLRLNKELEEYKSALENKNYISNVRFDREFEMYQELSEKNITLVYGIGEAVLITRGIYEDDPYRVDKHVEKLYISLNNAELTTKKYAAFIDEELFNKFHELQEQAAYICKLFNFWHMNTDGVLNLKEEKYTRETAKEAIETKQKVLSNLSDAIIKDMRNYLNHLVVIGG